MASSPRAPDPYKQASADQSAQLGAAGSSAILNNPNEVSPYGSVNYQIAGWEQVPDAQGKMQNVPRYTRTTSLSPDEQRIADYDTGTRYNLGRTATQQSAKIGSYLNTSMDPSGWQAWQMGAGPGQISQDFRQDTGTTDRAGIEDAMMASYRRQTDPQNRAAQAQLANRGLSPGSQGYGTYQQGQQDAQSEAARQAYLASGQESRQAQDAYNQVTGLRNQATQTQYELGANYADRANQLRQAQSQEAFALRNQPINEIMALLGGSQVNMPNFSPFSRQGISAASPGNYMASNYQNQLASTNAFNQGLFGLAGAAGQIGAAGFGKGGAWA
jgi:hypothetical protein